MMFYKITFVGVGDVVEFLLLGLRWGNLYELKDNTVSDIKQFLSSASSL